MPLKSWQALRFALAIVISLMLVRYRANAETYKTVQLLKSAMYADMKYTRACYKLLNASGPVGCEAPQKALVTAPLARVEDVAALPQDTQLIVVVPAQDADALLRQILSTPGLREQVVGVLVDPTSGRPVMQSAAAQFPGAAYAPYNASGHIWNPAGTGFSREWFGFPIFMLTDTLANETLWRATYNAEHDLKGGKHIARLKLPMEAEFNSSVCVESDQCLPVGGYGVWTALPPIPDPTYNTSGSARPITLLLTQLDSNSMFHDLTKAAGTSTSGLISSVVALSLIAQSGAAPTYSRQLAFAALAGEAWDFQGSKRLLYEMALNSSFVQGLRLELIDQVLEVGQVGGAWEKADNTSNFYLHVQLGEDFGDANAMVQTTLSVATKEPQVRVQRASESNPGIPPSSLMSFLRVKPSVAGMVFTDFDAQYKNPFYESEYDDGFNITIQAIVDASMVLARTLHSLAASDDTPPLELNRTVAVALVYQLALCLIADEPGMRCELAAQLMNPDIEVFYDGTSSAAAKYYTGVLRYVNGDPRTSREKPNLSRFLFNYLGNLTAVPLPANDTLPANPVEGAPCDTTVNICPAPFACIGWRYGTKDAAGMGRCRNTTTLYVPSYSTRLWYGPRDNLWGWWVDNSSARWERFYRWPADPMWTESNWPAYTPTVEVFQQESTATQVATLIVGLVLTFATGGVTWLAHKRFEKHLKTR